MRLPWEFSETDEELLASGEGTPNQPTPEGAAVGRDVAALADVGQERRAALGLPIVKRCDDCAFTKGTRPNRSLSTLGDAVKCVVEGVRFNCHKGESPGTRICGGFADALYHPALS